MGATLGLVTAVLFISFNVIVLLALVLWVLIWAIALALVVRIGRTPKFHLYRNDAYKAVVWTGVGFVLAYLGVMYVFQWFFLVMIIVGTGGVGYRLLRGRQDRSQTSPEMQRFMRTFVRWILPASAFLASFLIITLDFLRINNPWIILLGVILYLIPSSVGTVKSFKSLRSSK